MRESGGRPVDPVLTNQGPARHLCQPSRVGMVSPMTRTKSQALALAVLILCGCGGSEWVGAYMGIRTFRSTCTDGTGLTVTDQETWVISAAGADRLSLDNQTACAPVEAVMSDGVATIQPRECPVRSSGDFMVEEAVTGGRVQLRDHWTLEVSESGQMQVSGQAGPVSVCATLVTGVFIRQADACP